MGDARGDRCEIGLDLDERDDVGFVHQARPLIAGVLRATAPREAYLIKIDGWFGPRWLGFSYKMLGASGVSHRSTLRMPPFVPQRVIAERYLVRASSGEYEPAEPTRPLHVVQTSADNAKRLVSTMCPHAALFWWTGNTVLDGRGVVMAYLPSPDGHVGWYAELANHGGWSVSRTVGTSPAELAAFG